MVTIINLDVGKKMKTTDYGFQRDESPLPVIYFRLYEGDYVINYDDFTQLTLRIQLDINRTLFTKNLTEVVELNGEKLVKFDVTADLLEKKDNWNVTPTVRLSNKIVLLSDFKVIVYERKTIGMNGILNAINRFNFMYGLYLDSVKTDQIGVPWGVIPLDSTAKIPDSFLQPSLKQHILDTVRKTEVHGLRMTDDFLLEYYAPIGDRWYYANSIYGGDFGYEFLPPEEETTIHGGFFGGEARIIDGRTFANNTIDNFVDGEDFTDNTPNLVDAGNFNFVNNEDPQAGESPNPMLRPIFGGYFSLEGID